MSLDSRVIICPSLDQFFINRDTGLPLANGSLAFYRDVARTQLKDIYQLSGAPNNYTFIPFMTNPVVLSSVGTIVNANGDSEVIYLFPYMGEATATNPSTTVDLYYVVCRDQNGVEQWTREGWPAGGFINASSTNQAISNQISNPQFTEVFLNEFDPPVANVFNVTGANQTFPLGPEWFFVASGNGDSNSTISVTRIQNSGSANIPTNPPYSLDVQVGSSITLCKLVQRFQPNSGLWSSDPNNSVQLTTTLVATSQSGASSQITMYYQASSGAENLDPIQLINDAITANTYTLLKAPGVTIPSDSDTNAGANGYTDIYFSFRANDHVRFSSVQVVPIINSTVAEGETVDYDLSSANRDLALMGDYYIPALSFKPIPSLLTAWDFPLNPAQEKGRGNIVMPTAPTYAWDQTICATSGLPNSIQANAVTGGFQVTTGAANQACYMMQYLTGAQAKKILGTDLSVNVNAFITSSSSTGTVKMRVYLFSGKSSNNYANVVASTTADLGAVTYDNGANGVSARITKTAPLSALSIDGVALAVGQRVLVKNQTITNRNGIYIVTEIGDATHGWILTRSADYNTEGQINQHLSIFVISGTINANITYISSSVVTIIGTDPITYSVGSYFPLVPTLPASIGTFSSDVNNPGIFILNSTVGQGQGWSEIPRSNLPTASANLTKVAQLSDLNNANVDYGFNGWEITDNIVINDTDKFAIITTFEYSALNIDFVVNSISVVPGNIATRPAPKTSDEVLRESQDYYEKSYDNPVLPGTATVNGALTYLVGSNTVGATLDINTVPFGFQFKAVKRSSVPKIQFWSEIGTVSTVRYILFTNAARGPGSDVNITANINNFWVQDANSTSAVSYVPRGPSTVNSVLDQKNPVATAYAPLIRFQYVLDARLGII